MSNLIIKGGRKLQGRVEPSANKNAVLPILCATLFCEEPLTLKRVPDITDVRKILAFYKDIGSSVDMNYETGDLHICHGKGLSLKDAQLPKGMRSAIMLVPAMLHRFGQAKIENDVKGCTLGAREIDPHIDVFESFGAAAQSGHAVIELKLPQGFRAASHWMDYASVTTTENFVMCAALARGTSELINAASEPHVQEFCCFMQKLGAEIEGLGTSRLRITGVSGLKGCEFTFSDDFHEVATFLAIGAICGGTLEVKNSSSQHFPLIDRVFHKFGVEVEHRDGWSTAKTPNGLKIAKPFTQYILPKVEAAPWPYYPVDLLPIAVALGVAAEGEMLFWNKVYEGAFGWISELSKFGAHAVVCDPHRIITFGGSRLTSATVESPYIIRAAIAMLMLAASIEGKSVIENATPIRRAHPRFAEKLTHLGADIEWSEDN